MIDAIDYQLQRSILSPPLRQDYRSFQEELESPHSTSEIRFVPT